MTISKRPIRTDWIGRELDALTKRLVQAERRIASLTDNAVVGVAISAGDSTHVIVTCTMSDGTANVQAVPKSLFAP